MPGIKTSSKAEEDLWRRVAKAWSGDGAACLFELARQYTITYPKKYWGWIVLADALAEMAQYAQAQRALVRAQALAPRDRRASIYEQWGHLYRTKCSLRTAERWYRRALKEKETMHRLIYLGAVLARQGRFTEAKQCHSRATQLSGKSPDEAYYNLGLILRAERSYDEALKCFARAVKLDPSYSIAEAAWKDVIEARKLKKDEES